MPNRKDRTQALTARARFWIDDLHAQPDRCVVMRGKQEIKLELRMMEVLVMLAEHAGETITKERLLVEVWGSEIYGDSPVNKVISLLRDLIGDNARNPRYIETVSKVGFRMIATITLPEDYRRMPASPWKEGSPYVGLSAFDAKHSPVFCGRGRSISDLLRAMRTQMENERRFVMIVGASGCGKTSLLRAGAIPLLTKPDGFEGLRALSVADCDLAAAHACDPLTPLIAALATWTLGHDPVFPPQTTEQLKSQLCDSPDMIADLVAESLRRHSGCNLDEEPFAHLLLTIDHAEALVASADIDTMAREAFERLVMALCDCPHVLVTMITRSDFYPKLTETLPALAERKAGDGHLDVLPPRRGEIGEIIRTPAWKANLSFEMDPDSRNRLDDVLRDAAVAQPDALPLLQHTLDMLYDRCNEQQLLTFAVYHDIGGLEGAIAHRAKEVFSTLPANAQDGLDSVLARFIVVQPDSDTVSARRAYADDFRDGAKTLVDAFIAARLFVGDHSDGRATVGVAHEALLRRWPKAVEWTQDNRRLLQAKARLQRAAARWKEEKKSTDHLLNSGRPLSEAEEAANEFSDDLSDNEREFLDASQRLHHRKRRLKRTAISTLASLTLAMTIMAAVAMRLKNEAQENRRKAVDLIGYMLVELADELRPTASIQSLDSISTHALHLLETQPLAEMDVEDMVNYSRALRIRGEVLHAKKKEKQAISVFRRADKIARRSVERSKRSENSLFESAQTAYWLSETEGEEEATTHRNNYLRISNELLKNDQNNPNYMMEKSFALNSIGAANRDNDLCDNAMSYFEKSLFYKRSALDFQKNKTSWGFEFVVTQSNIIRCLSSHGWVKKADEGYAANIESLREIIKKKPDAIDWLQQLASLLHFNAMTALDLGNIDNADSRISESIELLRILTRLQPANTDWKRGLASALIKGSEISAYRGDKAASIRRLDEASQVITTQKIDGLPVNWQRIDAIARFMAATIVGSEIKETEMNTAINDLQAMALKERRPSYATIALGSALLRRGIIFSRAGRTTEADRDWRMTIEIADQRNSGAQNQELNITWVLANQLLRQSHLASAKLDELQRRGYNHPGLSDPDKLLSMN